MPFLPGQYVLLQVPGGQRRAYSMANTEAETLAFVVKEKPGGHASHYLFEELATGDMVSLEGPYGRAYLRIPQVREIVCVAGGSGLAPMLSVIEGALARPETPGIRLFFGANTAEELFMVEEMQALAAEHDRFSLILAVRDGAPGAATGLVGDIALAAMEDLDRVRFLHGRAAGADRRTAQAGHAERQGPARAHLLRPLLLSPAPLAEASQPQQQIRMRACGPRVPARQGRDR